MSFYGSAPLASVTDRVVQSANANDLTSRARRMIAAIAATDVILSAEFSAAGDGPEFVFSLTTAPEAVSSGGLNPATVTVQAFAFSSIQEFASNRAIAIALLTAASAVGAFRVGDLYAGGTQNMQYMCMLIGNTTPPPFVNDLLGAFAMGAVSGDPANPIVLAGPGTFWLGPLTTPPAAPALKNDSSAYVVLVASEIYGMATRQGTGGVGAVARTYTALLNDGAIVGATASRTPASSGYVRIANFTPVAIAAGDALTVSYTNIAAESTNNPAAILYTRPV